MPIPKAPHPGEGLPRNPIPPLGRPVDNVSADLLIPNPAEESGSLPRGEGLADHPLQRFGRGKHFRHPRLPHPQRGPSGSMVIWPTSPAMPSAPCQILPSKTKPPPTPVPRVMKQKSCTSLPAPIDFSPGLRHWRHSPDRGASRSCAKAACGSGILPSRQIGGGGDHPSPEIDVPGNTHAERRDPPREREIVSKPGQ